VVVLFHDHGSRYVGKMFNDDWMRDRGFLDEEIMTAGDIIAKHGDSPLVSLFGEELVSHAIDRMRKYYISQIPVMMDGKFVGSLDDSKVYQSLVEKPELRDTPVSSIMQEPFPIVKADTTIEELSKLINKETTAVLVELADGKHHIVTRHDLIAAIA
jgi:cystathionine beta-synthase